MGGGRGPNFSGSRGLAAPKQVASSDSPTKKRQLERPAQRAALRSEDVGFPPPEELGTQNDENRRPNTKEVWELAFWIGGCLRPVGIDPITGKQKRGPRSEER